MNKVLKNFIGVIAPLSMLFSLIGCSCGASVKKQDQIVNPKIEKIASAKRELEKIKITQLHFSSAEKFPLNINVIKQITNKIIQIIKPRNPLFYWIKADSLQVKFEQTELIFTSEQQLNEAISFKLTAQAIDDDMTLVTADKKVFIVAGNCLDHKNEAKKYLDEFKKILDNDIVFEKINQSNLLAKLEALIPVNEMLKFKFELDNKLIDFMNKNTIIDNKSNFVFNLTVTIAHCDDTDNSCQEVLTEVVSLKITGLYSPIVVFLEKFKNHFSNETTATPFFQAQIRAKIAEYLSKNQAPEEFEIEYEIVNESSVIDYNPNIFISAIDKATKNEVEVILINNIKVKSMYSEVGAMVKSLFATNEVIKETFDTFESFATYFSNKINVAKRSNPAINNLLIDYDGAKSDWETKVKTTYTNDSAQITVRFYLLNQSNNKIKNSELPLTVRVNGLRESF